jgi:hypothetical protein
MSHSARSVPFRTRNRFVGLLAALMLLATFPLFAATADAHRIPLRAAHSLAARVAARASDGSSSVGRCHRVTSHRADCRVYFTSVDSSGSNDCTSNIILRLGRHSWTVRYRGEYYGLSCSPAYSPPPPDDSDFCSTHVCIPNFYSGAGYIVQCADGMWSHSGGLPGACSYHGGEL